MTERNEKDETRSPSSREQGEEVEIKDFSEEMRDEKDRTEFLDEKDRIAFLMEYDRRCKEWDEMSEERKQERINTVSAQIIELLDKDPVAARRFDMDARRPFKFNGKDGVFIVPPEAVNMESYDKEDQKFRLGEKVYLTENFQLVEKGTVGHVAMVYLKENTKTGERRSCIQFDIDDGCDPVILLTVPESLLSKDPVLPPVLPTQETPRGRILAKVKEIGRKIGGRLKRRESRGSSEDQTP